MTQQERENKIEELESQIAELKAVKVEEPQPKRWKPERNEKFWYLNGDVYLDTWTDCVSDNFQYTIGNCFKTQEEAEEYKKQLEYTARYKNYIEEHSEPIDWNNLCERKYFAQFDEEVEINCAYGVRSQGIIYASSEQIIKDAIKEIGEDSFKKYVLEVK